jgi:sugar (pentulose or hexulose) kinase
MTELAVGIDLGTSGVRAAACGADGRVLAMARAEYAAGTAARDPAHWWGAASAAVARLTAELRAAGHEPTRIARIGVDGTSGTVVLTDSALEPVGRALMYDDAGFDAEAAVIARHAPDPHIARGPNGTLARALRLLAQPGAERAAHLMHQADFIAAKLMGMGGHTDVNNALKTGIDPATERWPDWMTGLGLPSTLLPRPHAPGSAIARVDAATVRPLGLPAGAMVHAGTTDSVAAFLAAAPRRVGAAVTSLGTTLAVKVFSDSRIDAPEIGLFAQPMGHGWLLGGASNTGGGVLRQFFSDARIASLSAQIDPSIESPLDYYPLPRPGERFPVNDPALALRLAPRPLDDAVFLHGLFESMARIERRAYAALAERGAPRPSRIVTAGGGAANPVWTAIRARVLGVPVMQAETPDAAVGTARLVLAARQSD